MSCEHIDLTHGLKVAWKTREGASGTGRVAAHWHIGDACMIDVKSTCGHVRCLAIVPNGDTAEAIELALPVAA